MNLRKYLFFSISAYFLSFASCTKTDESLPLIDDQYKDITVQSGFDNNSIKLASTGWTVAYVKDKSSEHYLLDSAGKNLQLLNTGNVVSQNGLLCLAKDSTGYGLSISLKENFSDEPRILLIGIDENGQRDAIQITQLKGSKYSLVDQEIRELDSLRKVYVTDEDCTSITLSNPSNEDKYFSDSALFKNVYSRSEFLSSAYGAFAWLPQNSDNQVHMTDLLLDGNIVWSDMVPYIEGESTKAFNSSRKSELLVKAHSNVDLTGNVTYCERTCKYTFTIKNEDTGFRFKISGLWHQKVPISSEEIINQVY